MHNYGETAAERESNHLWLVVAALVVLGVTVAVGLPESPAGNFFGGVIYLCSDGDSRILDMTSGKLSDADLKALAKSALIKSKVVYTQIIFGISNTQIFTDSCVDSKAVRENVCFRYPFGKRVHSTIKTTCPSGTACTGGSCTGGASASNPVPKTTQPPADQSCFSQCMSKYGGAQGEALAAIQRQCAVVCAGS